MKYLLATLLLLFSFTILIAQKEGNIWMLGYGGSVQCDHMGIDFNSGQADTFSICRPMGFFTTNSSLCDSSGNLLFYTNGYEIANGSHLPINNSNNFNPSSTNPAQDQLNIRQGTLILPVPENDSLYYIFHVNGEFLQGPTQTDFQPLELRYSTINMSDSLASVVPGRKNNILISDTLILGRLTATKHANGKDWWLITHKYWSDEYLVFHVMSDSIEGPIRQKIGSKITHDTVGKSIFNSDGSLLIMTGLDDFLDILNFDRCSGFLSERETIKFSEPFMTLDSLLIMDCAISANDTLLYVNNTFYLYQFDLTKDTIGNSRTRIDTWEGLFSPFSTCFNDMQLGPDGKIYVSTCQGTDRMHVIHNPNIEDTLCNFEQNLILPKYNAIVWPNLVNYALDSLAQSFCDSISLSNENVLIKKGKELIVYPVPSNDIVFFKFRSPKTLSFQLYNVTGRLVKKQEYYGSKFFIYKESLKSGIYFYRITTSQTQIFTGKIIFE